MRGLEDTLTEELFASVPWGEKRREDFVVNESVVNVESLGGVDIVELLFVGRRFVGKNWQRSEAEVVFP